MIGDEGVADHAARARQHVHLVGGDPGIDEDVAEQQGRERCQRRRLQDHRVAAGQGGRQLPARDQEREVPGHDQADRADRLAQDHVEPGVLHGHDRAEVLVGGSGVVLEGAGGGADLPAGITHGWPAPRLSRGEQVLALAEQLRDLEQHPPALGRRGAGPLPRPSSKARWAAVRARSTSTALALATVASG